jgi:hypothetical protein
MKSTTIKIDATRREALKDASFKVSMETGKIHTMTDVVKFLIDNHLEDAQREIVTISLGFQTKGGMS